MTNATLPRPLSLGTRLGFFNSFTMWMGMIFFALGLLLASFYFTSVSRQFRDDDPRVAGMVTEVFRPTNKSNTATSNNITYDYRYEVDGKVYEAQMVSTDRLRTDQVSVQYVPGAPDLSRIEGLDANGSVMVPVLALIFGLMGLLVLSISVSGALHDVRRIRHGIVTNATIVRKALANAGFTRVLQFTAADGRAYEIAPGPHVGILQEGESRPVFYVPGAPAEAVLLDHLEPEIRAFLN